MQVAWLGNMKTENSVGQRGVYVCVCQKIFYAARGSVVDLSTFIAFVLFQSQAQASL